MDNYKAARIHRATFRTAWRRKPHSLFGVHNNQKLLYISSWPTNCDHSISYPHKCNHSYFGGSGCGGALSGRTHARALQICGQSGKRKKEIRRDKKITCLGGQQRRSTLHLQIWFFLNLKKLKSTFYWRKKCHIY